IEFVGRIDTQVKIRGYRIELGEIESRLISHEKISDAVVIDIEDTSGDNHLAAYIVLLSGKDAGDERDAGDVSVEEVQEYLVETLPDYMVPAFITFLKKIPLTRSGKVDREKLPEVSHDFKIIYTPPRDAIEEKLVEIWSGVLAIPGEKIGIDANFFQLGGHSLKATILLAQIHKELDVRLPVAEIFKRPTIRRLAEYFEKAVRERFISIKPAEEKDYYVLSS
ncbi:MAG: hypothetical protein GY940_34565, partial [bacterium]|nr:hypothetical protein [bacterium]